MQSNKLQTEDIHFAVKSCGRFHDERLPIIQDTWLSDAINHAIYSDVKGLWLAHIWNFQLTFSCTYLVFPFNEIGMNIQ